MRVLMTGFTPIQVNSEHRRRDYTSFFHALERMVQALGYDYEWREVEPCEDLSKFDVALVGVFSPSSMMAAQNKFCGMWAALNLPHIIVADDWQVDQTFGQLNPKFFWGSTRLLSASRGWPRRNALEPHRERVDALLDQWGTNPPRLLISTYPWGDHSLLPMKSRDLTSVDRTPFAPKYRISPVPKERRWAFASLFPHDEWRRSLKRTWGIVLQCKLEASKHGGQSNWNYVSEEIVVGDIYNRCWGVLSPPYGHAGSGWFRSRFNFAIDAGCILYADPSEVKALPSYVKYPLSEIEALTDGGLKVLADEQAHDFLSRSETREQVLEKLSAALGRAVSGA